MNYQSKLALLGGIIDYAGTFPPAALSLEKALQQAFRWPREGKHPWLLNKVILPVSDIKKLTPGFLFEQGINGNPLLLAALGTPSQSKEISNSADFYRTVEWDLRELRRCHDKGYYSSCRQAVISYETKLPPSVTELNNTTKIYDFISPVLERTAHLASNSIRDIFFEISLEGNWQSAIGHSVESLAHWIEENDEMDLVPGLKFRTGGAYVPNVSQLTEAVFKVTSHGLRFKATQGLHSSVTHGNDFGFVNLFAALNFAQGYGFEKFGTNEIASCLSEPDSKQFQFSPTHFSWKDFSLSCEEIEVARRSHGATFGSCSLDEPDQDLSKEFP